MMMLEDYVFLVFLGTHSHWVLVTSYFIFVCSHPLEISFHVSSVSCIFNIYIHSVFLIFFNAVGFPKSPTINNCHLQNKGFITDQVQCIVTVDNTKMLCVQKLRL